MTTFRIPVLAACASLVLVTACTDINTSSNNPKQRTGEGAAIGAAIGAGIGILGGDDKRERRKNAVLGAIIGGGAGALIGNNLDKQAADLQSVISDDRIQIINEGDRLRVVMPQDILFAVDSTQLQGGLRSDLVALAGNLQRYPGSTIQVFGHTDNTGSASYNQNLSSARADSVAAVLIANGVANGRIRSIGVGEDDPVATNQTAAGRAQNRRVEIVIIPQK